MYNDRLRNASSDGGACQTLTTRVHNLNLVVWCRNRICLSFCDALDLSMNPKHFQDDKPYNNNMDL